MDYTLRELECFSAVAEELSFTKAARRLHLAQPPLSRHIRVLEEKIGAPLFERSSKSISLTNVGTLFYEETRGVLQQIMRAGELAKRTAQGEVERLRIGFVSAVFNQRLVEALRHFRDTHPGTQIILYDLPPSEQLRHIASGKLDAGFVGILPSQPPSGIHFKAWHQERLVALLPSGHPLAQKRQLCLPDLAKENFVSVSRTSAPDFAAMLQELCRKAGFRPKITVESPRAQAVAVMVAAGTGIALLPEAVANLVGSAIITKPLQDAPILQHVFAHPIQRQLPALQPLLKLLHAGSPPKVKSRTSRPRQNQR